MGIMTLSHELNVILDHLRNRKIINKDAVSKMMVTLNFDSRLIEDLSGDELKIEDLIDELLNQSLIWVDDETFQGNIIYLQKVIMATNNYDELLPLYNNLLSSLKNSQDIPRPSLPEGLIRDISNIFDICGWWKCRAFLVDLGLEEGILNRIESDSPNTKVRLRQALGTFQSKLDPTEVDNRQLIQLVHSSLQEADMIREAPAQADTNSWK